MFITIKPEGEVGHLRRITVTHKETTGRTRYRWQATAPGKVRCTSQDFILWRPPSNRGTENTTSTSRMSVRMNFAKASPE